MPRVQPNKKRHPSPYPRPQGSLPSVWYFPSQSSKRSSSNFQRKRLLLNESLMGRWPQPCAVCGILTKGTSRCDLHEREYRQRRARAAEGRVDAQRKSKLYNYAYRQEAKRVKANATHCHLCKEPFLEGQPIEADHLIPGLVGSPLAAAHRICNQRRGAKPLDQ